VIVVKADHGAGESTAARFIVQNSAGGIMFCNCWSTGTQCYWKGVAQAVGIPAEVYENDSTWETLLVKAVAAAKLPDDAMAKPAWTDRLLERLLSTCVGTKTSESSPGNEDQEAPTIQGLSLSPLKAKKRAIIIFDDFNDVRDEDILFMRHLFPIIKGHGVLAFVLVRDERTANQLLALNGWGRISPLEGICKDVGNEDAGEKIPLWRPPKWGKAQLEALVRSRFGDVDISLLELDGSENPLDVLDKADSLF
jgi:hypothetical protein